ncbi:MAG: branched-chain amino acid ABC transporter permease [Acidothermus cellulolyticus]|nr:branched-chain amino acid ABC transporter permease [Acidothermus cellulolyticus]
MGNTDVRLRLTVGLVFLALLTAGVIGRGPFVIVDLLVSGSTWSLMAVGLSLVFGVMNVLNFAQGAFFMVGTLVAYLVFTKVSSFEPLGPVVALAAAFAVGGIGGYLIDVGVFSWLRRRSDELWLISSFVVTLGVAVALAGLHQLIWGPNFKAISHYWAGPPLRILGTRVARDELMTVIVGGVVIGALTALLKYSRFGRTVRAVAQDERGASMCGINVAMTRAVTFGIGCALAALAGAVLLFRYPSSPTVGDGPLGIAFTVVILSGLGNIVGAIPGGLIVALLQTLTDSFLGATWESVVTFSVLVAILLVRPQGIFGRRLAGVWER